MSLGVKSESFDADRLTRFVSHRARASKLPRQLSDDEYSLFHDAGSLREAAAGEMIFRKGEIGQSMFVIESGEIQLEFGDGMPRKLLGEREFLGELALFIGDHSRVAGAYATQPTRLRVIEHAIFDRLLETHPALLAQFMRRSFSYLVASEQQLIANLKRRNEDLIAILHSLRQTETELGVASTLVRTDELTGLVNRRGLYQFLETLPQQRLPGMQLGLLLIDLDRFKQINDHLGHIVGDRVLRAVAGEIANAASSGDLACRLGGDEFALLVQLRDQDELEARAATVIAAIEAMRLPPPHGEVRVSVSVGASLCRDGTDWATWYTDADGALYTAKDQHRCEAAQN